MSKSNMPVDPDDYADLAERVNPNIDLNKSVSERTYRAFDQQSWRDDASSRSRSAAHPEPTTDDAEDDDDA